jgi:dihydroorotase
MTSGPHEITLRAPDNWHAHFREGAMLDFLVPVFLQSGWRRRIVAMPNITPPVLTGERAVWYRDLILERARAFDPATTVEPVMTIQITEQTTAAAIREAFALGVRMGKVYPFMVTTHSGNGVQNYAALDPALAAAEELGLTVLFHGEHPDEAIEGLDKEAGFLVILDGIRARFPKLRLTMEHITSRAAVDWVKQQGEWVGASITVHHLFTTVDDVLGYSKKSGGLMRVHCGCKPQPKFRDDQAALREIILDGHPRFFYGGDDAAHLKHRKESAGSACGVWNTMAGLPLLLDFFEQNGKLEGLDPFLSEFGARFYGYPLSRETVTLVREAWRVPEEVEAPGLGDTVVPMCAGETLAWRVLA